MQTWQLIKPKRSINAQNIIEGVEEGEVWRGGGGGGGIRGEITARKLDFIKGHVHSSVVWGIFSIILTLSQNGW